MTNTHTYTTPGTPPSEVRILRDTLRTGMLKGSFHYVMFSEQSVDYIANEYAYRRLTLRAEQILEKYHPGVHIIIDVTGFDNETHSYEGNFILYENLDGKIQESRYTCDIPLSLSPAPVQQKHTKNKVREALGKNNKCI